jgi:SAM-dependent MidA family methyltransferase
MQTTILTDLIIQDIQQSPSGSIPFSRFMQRALYEPEYGYYRRGQVVIGKHADYMTAPETSSLFGQCIAQNIHVLQSQLPNAQLMEVGAGNGTLAADILITLADLDSLPKAYLIIELDKYHQQRQQATIQQKCPQLFTYVHWLDSWPMPQEEIIFIANELLDALPVNTYVKHENYYKERCVTFCDGQFCFCEVDTENINIYSDIIDYLNHVALPSPYYFEVGAAIPHMLQQISNVMHKGAILLFDYGYPRKEYYHPERYGGHIVCYYQQQMNFDPLYQPGLQDISTHVDFTFVAEYAEQIGLEISGFCSQAAFLLSSGLMDFAAKNSSCETEYFGQMQGTSLSSSAVYYDVHEQRRQACNTAVGQKTKVSKNFAMNQAIQLLTSPAEMGELIKVLALGKNFSPQMPGFYLRNDRGRL